VECAQPQMPFVSFLSTCNSFSTGSFVNHSEFLSQIPEELLPLIILETKSIRSFVAISQTSRYFNNLLQQHSLWQKLAQKLFPEKIINSHAELKEHKNNIIENFTVYDALIIHNYFRNSNEREILQRNEYINKLL